MKLLVGLFFILSPVILPAARAQSAPAKSLDQIADKDLSNIGLELATSNTGFIVSVDKQPELDMGAVRINFESISENVSRADMMRVVLQAISKIAPYGPSLIVIARAGQERLLLDGKDVPDVALQYGHDKPIPAWTLFAERAVRPDGGKMKLPDGLLARTTASFALVDELLRNSTADGKSAVKVASGPEDDELKSADSWHSNSDRKHGEVVSRILASARATSLTIKDGSYLDFQQVDRVLFAVNDGIGKSLTDAKIALEQREQGGKAEVPDGSSELLGLELRFDEIFGVTDDNVLVPVTNALLDRAPESTFAGLTVYGKHHEVKSRITGKAMAWHSGVSTYSNGHSYYTTFVETDKGDMLPSMNDIMLRWGDIKDKIAVDFSEQKSEEDSTMERQALDNAQ